MTARLVPAATEDALALLLDDGVADARFAAASDLEHLYEASRERVGDKGQESRYKTKGPGPKSEFDACQACAGGGDTVEREKALGADGVPRWRLWHKSKVRQRRAETCKGHKGRVRITSSGGAVNGAPRRTDILVALTGHTSDPIQCKQLAVRRLDGRHRAKLHDRFYISHQNTGGVGKCSCQSTREEEEFFRGAAAAAAAAGKPLAQRTSLERSAARRETKAEEGPYAPIDGSSLRM